MVAEAVHEELVAQAVETEEEIQMRFGFLIGFDGGFFVPGIVVVVELRGKIDWGSMFWSRIPEMES
jgi:glycosyltransferase A (GT-A) superfamily protein (DUF2064 family)